MRETGIVTETAVSPTISVTAVADNLLFFPRYTNTLTTDENGRIWAGHGDYSLYGRRGGFSIFSGKTQIHNNTFSPAFLTTSPDGTVWGSLSYDLRQWHDGAWQKWEAWEQFLQSQPDDYNLRWPIYDIAFQTQNQVWIANGFRLIYYGEQDWRVYEASVASIAIDSHGIVWAVGWDGLQDSFYVASFDGITWTRYMAGLPGDNELPTNARLFQSRIFITPDDTIWLWDQKQLLRLVDNRWQRRHTLDNSPMDCVQAISLSPAGHLWGINQNTLFRFDPQTNHWQTYNLNLDETACTTFTGLAITAADEVWFAANRGVYAFSPPDDPDCSPFNC